MGTINSDEHDAKHGVRSGEEQPLALEHRDKPGGVILLTIHREKKQGRVCERSGMEASASEPECSGDEQSRPIFVDSKIGL
jgi:hypothetical protein